MKRSLKNFVSILLTTSILFSLTACATGAKPDASTPAAADTTAETPAAADTKSEAPAADANAAADIRFSWWGGDSRHEATDAAIKAFMAKNPNIKVSAEYGAWDGWPEKVATQLKGGTAPDLVQTNWNWLYQFSSDGSKFVDLNEYSNIISLTNYDEKVLEEGVVAGKLQGLPLGITGKVFVYNSLPFEQAGLSAPTSFEEIINAGTVFKEKLGDEYYPLAMYEYERMILMLYYLQSKYGKDWAVDNKVNYTVEEIKEGLDWMNSLEEAHVLPKISTLKGDGATILEKNIKWINGQYGGFYEWDSAQNKLKEALADNTGFMLGEFPMDLGSNPAGFTKVTMCYSITESSKYKEAAASLLEFLTSDPEGIEIVGLERGMLSNKVANETLEASGKLAGLTFEGNKAVSAIANFSVDPNFENSSLKDPTGIYYEVFENLSGGIDSAELAQYLYDSINDVYAANPY